MKRFLSVLLWGCVLTLAGSEVLRVPFNGTLPSDSPARKVKFVPGLRQGTKAAVFTDNTDAKKRVVWNKPLLNAEKGAISLWFKAENWKGSDPGANIFFAASGKESGRFILYKPQQRQILFFYSFGSHAVSIPIDVRSWKPGTWHHLVGVWSGSVIKLYLDGALVGEKSRQEYGKGKMDSLFLGSYNWGHEKGETALAELRLFDAPVSRGDIAKIQLEDTGKKLEDFDFPVSLSCENLGMSTTAVTDGKIDANEYPVEFPLGFDGAGYFSDSDELPRWFMRSDYSRFTCGVRGKPDAQKLTVRLYDHGKVRIFTLDANGKVSGDLPAGVSCGSRVVPGKFAEFEWGFQTKEKKLFFDADLDGIHLAPVEKDDDVFNFAAVTLKKFGSFHLRTLGRLDLGALKWDAVVPEQSKLSVRYRNRRYSRRYDYERRSNRAWLRFYHGFGINGEMALDLITTGGQSIFRVQGKAPYFYPVEVKYVGCDRDKKYLFARLIKAELHCPGKMLIELCDEKSGEVFASAESAIPEKQNQWDTGLDFSKLAPRIYQLRICRVAPDGKKSHYHQQLFRIPEAKPAWQDNKFGIFPGEVPPPWIPLKTGKNRIKALMQEYAFAASPLPAELSVSGNPIFYAPPEMILNGERLAGAWKIDRTAADETTWSFTGNPGSITVTGKMKAEFDGFLWFDIKLSGKPETAIDSLKMEFFLKREYSEMVSNNLRGDHRHVSKGGNGVLGDLSWQMNFIRRPAFWIGGDEGGISLTSENLPDWYVRKPESMISVVPVPGKGRQVTVTMVDKTLKMKQGRSYSFGLQGTPVKPAPQDVRVDTMNFTWSMGSGGQRYFNSMYLEPEFFDAKQREKISLYHFNKRQMKREHFYTSSRGISPYAPDWLYWGTLWNQRPHGQLGAYVIETSLADDAARDRSVWTVCCTGNKSFRDFRVAGYAGIINTPEWRITDLYCDQVGPDLCWNETHGCTYLDEDGKRHPTYNLLGSRDLQKRIWFLMWKHLPGSKVSYHATGQASVTPVTAFCTEFADGEDAYNGELARRETYFGLLEPGQFRASFYGDKWGIKQMFIPQFARTAGFLRPERVKFWIQTPPHPDAVRAFRHFLGYAMSHDVAVWFSDPVMPRIYDEWQRKFASYAGELKTTMEFLPYWQSERHGIRLAPGAPERVMLSAYRQNGVAALILFNDTDARQQVTFAPALKDAGKYKLVDFDGKEIAPATLGKWDLTIERQEVNFYFFAPAK